MADLILFGGIPGWWLMVVNGYMIYIYIYLVGGIPTPLKNMTTRQLG